MSKLFICLTTESNHLIVFTNTPPAQGWGLRTERGFMTDETTNNVLNRLKSIEGHVRGIELMVEHDKYCIDIVNQILAVQRALHKVTGIVLERHLHTCVTTAIRCDDPDERERVIGEILDVVKTTGRL